MNGNRKPILMAFVIFIILAVVIFSCYHLYRNCKSFGRQDQIQNDIYNMRHPDRESTITLGPNSSLAKKFVPEFKTFYSFAKPVNNNKKNVHFGIETTRMFNQETDSLLDYPPSLVKSKDADFDLKDPRYYDRMRRCEVIT